MWTAKSVFFFNVLELVSSASQVGDVVGKTIVGYQGWFSAPGDGSPFNSSWWHWASDMNQPMSAINYGVVSWPDVRDYTSTFKTNFSNLGNGQPATLFSSFTNQTVNKHFEWMQLFNIDGAALQRFNPTGSEGPSRDATTARVRTAAETYGRKFYIMYDISGWFSMQTDIKTDWTNKMQSYTNSTAYARQNGKPVVCIWGFGFNDSNHNFTVAQCQDVVNWFKNQGLYVIGGVPTHWRTSDQDSRSSFTDCYNTFNMLSPWMIGRIGSISDVNSFYNNTSIPDQQYCNNQGIDYQPCILPGDLHGHQRVHGDFMWRQFYNMKQLGAQGIYISMFDEFNEGNQIVKTAENSSYVPVNANTSTIGVTLDEDGTKCSADYYMRLTGDGNRMFQGKIPLTSIRPTMPCPQCLNGVSITLQCNTGLFVTSSITSGGPLVCNRASAGAWETFTLIDAGNGLLALNIDLTWNGVNYGNYVSSENGVGPMSCNRTSVGPWESFIFSYNNDGSVSLMGSNGNYVSSNNSTSPLTCDRTSIGSWETFKMAQV